jgi:transposase
MVQVAWAAVKKKGSYYKDKFFRLAARRGPKKAIVAIANRLIKAAYHVINDDVEFHDLGENYLLLRHQSRKLSFLNNRLKF